MSELIRKYSNAVEFHLLPLEKLQMFFDCQEILLFCDVFHGFKLIRESNFNPRHIEYQPAMFEGPRRSRSNTISSESSHTWMQGLGASISRVQSIEPVDTFFSDAEEAGFVPYEDSQLALVSRNNIVSSYGNRSGVDDVIVPSLEENHRSRGFSFDDRPTEAKPVLQVYSFMTYKLVQERLHEFMISILGMTVFDGAELWLLSSSGDASNHDHEEDEETLMLVAAVYKSGAMKKWVLASGGLHLRVGLDVPGRCMAASQPVWDNTYGMSSDASSSLSSEHPRSALARSLGVQTAYSAPVPGLGGQGTCGVISFYSSKMVGFIFLRYLFIVYWNFVSLVEFWT